MYIVANQLELNNGIRRDRAECVADAEQIVSPPALQKRGSLFILTETETMAAGQPRPGDIDLCREAQEVIIREYYNSQLTASVTSALRQAIEKANQAIFNRNSVALPPDRRGVGITVALVRNNELYTAQLPPTQAFLAYQGEIRYLPALEKSASGSESVGVARSRTGTDPQATMPLPRRQILPALGRYSQVEPTFNRNVFEEGSVLVLCSARFTAALKKQTDLQWLFANQDSRNVLLNFSELARSQGLTDGYVFSIGGRPDLGQRAAAFNPAEETPRRPTAESGSLFNARTAPTAKTPEPSDPYNQPTFSPSRDYNQPTARNQSAKIPAAKKSESEPPAPSPANAGKENWLHREDDDLNRPPFLRGRALHPDKDKEAEAGAFQNQQAGVYEIKRDFTYTDASQEPTFGAGAGAGAGGFHAPPPSFDPAPPPPATEPEPVRANRASRSRRPDPTPRVEASPPESPYFDLGGASLGASPTEPEQYDEPTERRTPSRNRRVPVRRPSNQVLIMAGVGLVVVVAVVILLISLVGKPAGDSNKAAELVRSAEQKRSAAQQQADGSPAQARILLTQAQTDLDAARKAKPDLPDLVTEQNALDLTYNNINRVVVPGDLRLVNDLSTQGTGVRLTRGLLSPTGDSLYLLDSGRGAVYSAGVSGTVTTLLKTGDKADGATLGKPLKLVARPDGLLVLDDANILWIYNKAKGSWSTMALGGAGAWGNKTVQQAASYEGNFYVVGPGNGQILKYTAGNYGGNPENWLDPALAPQLGMDTAAGLSIDGTIYALTRDGKLLQLARPSGKNQGAVLQQYDLKNNDRLGPPLSNPTAIEAGSLNFPYVFVMDGEKRLMQFSKSDGSFVQQYQAASGHQEFDNLQDVVIDEAGKKLYLIGPQKVYSFALPGATLAPAGPGTPANPTQNTVAGTPGAATNVVIIGGNPTPTK